MMMIVIGMIAINIPKFGSYINFVGALGSTFAIFIVPVLFKLILTHDTIDYDVQQSIREGNYNEKENT